MQTSKRDGAKPPAQTQGGEADERDRYHRITYAYYRGYPAWYRVKEIAAPRT